MLWAGIWLPQVSLSKSLNPWQIQGGGYSSFIFLVCRKQGGRKKRTLLQGLIKYHIIVKVLCFKYQTTTDVKVMNLQGQYYELK